MVRDKDCRTYHATRISSGNTLYDGPPDVEILACSAPTIGTTIVTLAGTRVDIILVQKRETHILKCRS